MIKFELSAHSKKSIKDNLRDLRGGVVDKKGFVWTDEIKVRFYKTVEELPKIKNESAWEFAAEQLFEEDFDYETIKWVKSSPAFVNVPESLFDEAIKHWRKYGGVKEIKVKEHNPRFFEFRHALHLLEYPDKFAFSTLRTRYFEGKKLDKNNI